ncbi:MAG: hypothetical protein ABIK68_12160 [bacterium]
MKDKTIHFPPKRVTDLVELKRSGSDVACELSFEVLPVDFAHRDNPFQAYIFLCRYAVMVDGEAFMFRKCYARGCPHNLCPHVSQAVMIANRYLYRDYHRMREIGIEVEEKRFTLQEMLTKFDNRPEEKEPVLTIHDYINIAREGHGVAVKVDTEFVSAVEHFDHTTNRQTFLNGYFTIETLGKTGHYQRCLGCYPTETEKTEKPLAIVVANQRLSDLYQDFDEAGITYKAQFFEYGP